MIADSPIGWLPLAWDSTYLVPVPTPPSPVVTAAPAAPVMSESGGSAGGYTVPVEFVHQNLRPYVDVEGNLRAKRNRELTEVLAVLAACDWL